MKAMKKVLALALALAMTVTAVPVTGAEAATAKLKAGKTVSKSYYAGTKHALKLNGVKAANVTKTTWKSSDATIVKCIAGTKTKTSAKIRCVAAGKATITAKVTLKTNKTKTYKAKVTVKAISVEAKAETNRLAVGETTTISATKVGPKSAALNYKSENDAIVTVSGGKVTATGAGTANVIVELVSGNKVKRALVPFTVTAVEDGLNLVGLANPISAEYPDTVWVNEQAAVRVQLVRNGKPASSETLIMMKKATSVDSDLGAPVFASTAVTDSNGIATFVVGYRNAGLKATNVAGIGTFDFTVSTASGAAEPVEGQVTFAAISLGNVTVVNREDDDKRPSGINKLAVSTNDKGTRVGADGSGDGWTETRAAYTDAAGGHQAPAKEEYVDSQQVSPAGKTDHQVAFKDYMPRIAFPDSSTELSKADKFTQKIDKSSGKYGVYTDNAEIIKLEVAPRELTYASLNFSKIQLSKYTRLVISYYDDEGRARYWNNGGSVWQSVIEGEADMPTGVSVQIPLEKVGQDKDVLWIRVHLESKGQVNTDKNGGYELKDITGVFRKDTLNKGKSVPLKGAKVTWSTVSAAPMSEIRELSTDEKNAISWWGTGNIFASYKRVTYQVPVFPYTGNAVFTCYDEKDQITYYVCPTINGGAVRTDLDLVSSFVKNKTNENILAIPYQYRTWNPDYVDPVTGDKGRWEYPSIGGAEWIYKVTREEAFNQVGEIVSQDDTMVIVNSEKVGVTTLKGEITVDGQKLEALDASNDTLYTSVQWCPLPKTAALTEEAALIGQNVDVIAQLVDTNGNPVTESGVGITFAYTANTNVSKVNEVLTTDSNGQAKLTLVSAKQTVLLGLNATSTSGSYSTKLIFSNGEEAEKAEIYWLDADLKFVDSTNSTNVDTTIDSRGGTYSPGSIQTTAAKPFVETKEDNSATHTHTYNWGQNVDTEAYTMALEPSTGTNWDFGFQTIGNEIDKTTYPTAKWKETTPKIYGLDIKMARAASNVGTASFKNENGVGIASTTSNKEGKMDISGKLDSTSVTANTKIEIEFAWYCKKVSVGYGATSINKKLTLNTVWKPVGYLLSPVEVNSACAAFATTGAAIGTAAKTVYFKVTDKNGSPLKNRTVYFYNDGVLAGNANSDDYGIVSHNVSTSDTTKVSTVVKAVYTVPGTTDEFIATQTIRWINNPHGFEVDFGRNDEDNAFVTTVKNGQIFLTFTNNVSRTSVIKDMFAVYTTLADASGGHDRDKKYDVVDYNVYGNMIILTVKNLPTNLAADEAVEVVIASKLEGGITYILTSDEGEELPDTSIWVYDSTVTTPTPVTP